jgi:hypothetical protein
MVVSRIDLLIIAAAAGGVLWIEHANRIRIETSTPAEIAQLTTAVCPENESVPFSADCMALIQGGVGSDVRRRLNAADGALADSPELP